jgi:hypothetical protein
MKKILSITAAGIALCACFATVKAYANDGGMAAIDVVGIKTSVPLTGTNEMVLNMTGETLRPFMAALPPSQGAVNPDGTSGDWVHYRAVMIVSKAYNIVIGCVDVDDNAKPATPSCNITAKKNYEPNNPDNGDSFAWEPGARMQASQLADVEFVKQEAGRMAIMFYGKEASKFLKILPAGGNLMFTGGVNGGNDIAVSFTCKTGQQGSMTAPGAVCTIKQGHYTENH